MGEFPALKYKLSEFAVLNLGIIYKSKIFKTTLKPVFQYIINKSIYACLLEIQNGFKYAVFKISDVQKQLKHNFNESKTFAMFKNKRKTKGNLRFDLLN